MKISAKFTLGGLLALALAVQSRGGIVRNPSFEANYNDTWPHYGTVDEWSGGSGVNDSTGPFHNAGTAIPDVTRAVFIQGSDKTLSQMISGLVPGKKYWIQFFYDARSCCGGSINLATKIDDKSLDNIVNVRPATAPREYYSRSVSFTAEAETANLAFATTGDGGDATVLIDAVTVVQRDDGNVVLLNPSFESSGDVADPGTVTALGGWTITGTVGISAAVNGAIPDQDHVVTLTDASSISQRVSSLLTNRTYQLVLAYNSLTGSSAHIQAKVGNTVLFEEDVAPVTGNTAFKTRTVSFTATDVTAEITIAQTKTGQVLLVDNVRLLGETGKELPPLTLSPASAELSQGERTSVTVTVPAEALATRALDIVLQTSAAGVGKFVDASGVLLSQTVVHFDRGGTNARSATFQAVGRGSAVIQVTDPAGLKVANQFSATVVAALLKNPSFESTPVPAGVGYGAIAGWVGGSGLNSPPGPFSDNGIVPDRKQIGFIQGSQTLSQNITGLEPGKNYWLQFFYNARNAAGANNIDLVVKMGGKQVASIPGIVAVGADVPYNFRHIEFVAETASQLLEFVTTAHGDTTVLLDGITIVQRDAGQVVVKNPSFEASGSVYPFPGYVQPNLMAGWDATGGRGMNIDGAGPFTDNGRAGDQDLVAFLQGNGASLSQTLTGLTAGTKYIVGFLVNARRCCGPEESSYVVNFDGGEIGNETFAPVGGSNPYLVRQGTFTAGSTEGILNFTHTTGQGDHTLLLDNIVVVRETGSTPVILFSPGSVSVETGASANFFAGAIGGGTISYQWKRNGAALAGKTESTLAFDAVTTADAGDYTVEVKNNVGAVTSKIAKLTVLESIPGLFDTGTSTNATVAATGAVDLHYVLAVNVDDTSSTKAYVQDDTKWPIAGGPWFANTDLSKWIGPRVDPGAATAGGDYTYRTTLDLSNFDPSTVVLSGSWAVDNSVELAVNGVGTGIKKSGFDSLSTFAASGVFKQGVNNLDFKVVNGDAAGGPTGLRVEGLKAVGAKSTATPPQSVKLARTGTNVRLSWPVSAAGFVLQSTSALPGGWVNDTSPVTVQGSENTVTIAISGKAKYYRLFR